MVFSSSGILSRLVLQNTTLASNSQAVNRLYQLLQSDNGFLTDVVLDDATLLTYDGARKIAQGFWRTTTLKHLSLLNAQINTDSAAILLDAMTQSGVEMLALRNKGLRLVETYKYYQSLPKIDSKVLNQIKEVGDRNKMIRLKRESRPEL